MTARSSLAILSRYTSHSLVTILSCRTVSFSIRATVAVFDSLAFFGTFRLRGSIIACDTIPLSDSFGLFDTLARFRTRSTSSILSRYPTRSPQAILSNVTTHSLWAVLSGYATRSTASILSLSATQPRRAAFRSTSLVICKGPPAFIGQ